MFLQTLFFRFSTSEVKREESEVWKRGFEKGKVSSETTILDVELIIEGWNDQYSGSKPDMNVGE